MRTTRDAGYESCRLLSGMLPNAASTNREDIQGFPPPPPKAGWSLSCPRHEAVLPADNWLKQVFQAEPLSEIGKNREAEPAYRIMETRGPTPKDRDFQKRCCLLSRGGWTKQPHLRRHVRRDASSPHGPPTRVCFQAAGRRCNPATSRHAVPTVHRVRGEMLRSVTAVRPVSAYKAADRPVFDTAHGGAILLPVFDEGSEPTPVARLTARKG